MPQFAGDKMPKRVTPSKYPYKPSWQNRFFSMISQAPVSRIYVFLGLFAAAAFLIQLIAWIQGLLPWGEIVFNPFLFLIPSFVVLVVYSTLIDISEAALIKFREALNASDGQFALLRFRFLNIPARVGWVITLLVFLAVLLIRDTPYFQDSFPGFLLTGISGFVILTIAIIPLSIVFAFFYFIFHQARLINQFFGEVRRINLFDLASLYALSSLSSRVAGLAITVGTISFLSNFLLPNNSPQIAINIFFGIINIALATLILFVPSWGIHLRLSMEKARLVAENGRRLAKINSDLMLHVDRNKLSDLSGIRNGASALLEIRKEIEKISTWPWDTSTMRNFITALAVPMTIWIVQQVLLLIVGK
jgi:hypothetical protein